VEMSANDLSGTPSSEAKIETVEAETNSVVFTDFLSALTTICVAVCVHNTFSRSLRAGLFYCVLLAGFGTIFGPKLQPAGLLLWRGLSALLVSTALMVLMPVSLHPGHARELVALLARVSFCTSISDNLAVMRHLRKDGRTMQVLGFNVDDIGPLLLVALLAADQLGHTFFFWRFPCPVFNASMLLGFFCARVTTVLIATASSRGLSLRSNPEVRWHAVVAVLSFQILCFVLIPTLMGESEGGHPPQDNHKDGTLLRATSLKASDISIPEPYCERVQKNELSADAFFALARGITGWDLLPETKAIFYELVRASGHCRLSDPVLTKISEQFRSDWIFPKVGLPSLSIPGVFQISSLVHSLNDNLKGLITALTATVSLISTLRVIMQGSKRGNENVAKVE